MRGPHVQVGGRVEGLVEPPSAMRRRRELGPSGLDGVSCARLSKQKAGLIGSALDLGESKTEAGVDLGSPATPCLGRGPSAEVGHVGLVAMVQKARACATALDRQPGDRSNLGADRGVVQIGGAGPHPKVEHRMTGHGSRDKGLARQTFVGVGSGEEQEYRQHGYCEVKPGP